MYILYDLSQQNRTYRPWPCNPMSFEDKSSLLDFWARKIGGDFDMLNVTGKDVFVRYEYIGTASLQPGLFGFSRIEHRYLKPYMVTDEYGRHLDIREWGMEPKVVYTHHLLNPWMNNGFKKHGHRISGPSMRRRTMRDNQIGQCIELDNGEHIAIPGIRDKVLVSDIDTSYYYDKNYMRGSSKSWKDQHKARRQYAKHEPIGHGKSNNTDNSLWQSLSDDGFPVSPATLAG